MTPQPSPLRAARTASGGRVHGVKPCLKSPLPRLCPESLQRRAKTVVFGDEILEEIYLADVWDRTPTEPTKKLTYQWVFCSSSSSSPDRVSLRVFFSALLTWG